MAQLSTIIRSSLLAGVFTAAHLAVGAEDPVRIVFKNGPSIPASAVTLTVDKEKGDRFVVKTDADPYKVGQEIPFTSADHIYGVKPVAVSQGVVVMLTGKPKDAIKLLESVVSEQRITAKISGNFWLEAARTLLVAYALNGQAKECTDLGKEIAEAAHIQGIEPFASLGKALLMPATLKFDDREIALRDLTTGTLPADVCAYASFFRGNLYKKEKRNVEALEAYLSVPCLYPSGGLALMAVAEMQAAELLGTLNRRDEAIDLCRSAVRDAVGTTLVQDANKRIESLK